MDFTLWIYPHFVTHRYPKLFIQPVSQRICYEAPQELSLGFCAFLSPQSWKCHCGLRPLLVLPASWGRTSWTAKGSTLPCVVPLYTSEKGVRGQHVVSSLLRWPWTGAVSLPPDQCKKMSWVTNWASHTWTMWGYGPLWSIWCRSQPEKPLLLSKLLPDVNFSKHLTLPLPWRCRDFLRPWSNL